MRKTLFALGITAANIIVAVILIVSAILTHFYFYGESQQSGKYYPWVIFFFGLVHLGLMTLLYRKKRIFNTPVLMIINVLIVVILYVFNIFDYSI